ncbi:hypothetical protein ACIFOE_20075 [Paenibacillus sp. NRS-1783]|uniref:hypothetical protein n=1 Tax=Paenibacillus sp. NRS-1783 TaxID=3233907 RepID=UPI003D27B9CD
MTTTSQTTLKQVESMFEAAAQQGPLAMETHLRDLAFSLGAQAAIVFDPRELPTAINNLITEFGKGIQTAMQEAHGFKPGMDVVVHAVHRN